MTENINNNTEEQNISHKFIKRYKKPIIWVTSIVISLFIIQLAFYFFAKPILKNYIERKVTLTTDSLYSASFSDIQVNLAKRSFTLTEFKITPDTNLYKKLVKENNYNKPIFAVNLDTFQLKKISIINLFGNKRKFKIEKILFDTPIINVVAKPDDGGWKKKNKKKEEVSVESLKENLLPQLFKYLYSINVEKLEVKNGNFDFLQLDNLESQKTFSAKNISVIFNNFYVDKKNYKKEKDLFTEDIEIIIDEYTLYFKDKIHTLKAKEFYVSTKGKQIKLSNIKLLPAQVPYKKLKYLKENVMNISVSELVLNNTDFAEIYFDKKLHITNAVISEPKISIYKQKPENIHAENDTVVKSIDLYKMLKGNIEFTQIDSFRVQDAGLKIYKNIWQEEPQTEIRKLNVSFFDFRVDSSSHADKERILYAKNVFMDMYGFNLNMADEIHSLSAERLLIDSRQKKISAKKITLLPDSLKIKFKQTKNLNKILIPAIELSGVDISKYVNYRELYVDVFEIPIPVIELVKHQKENKYKNNQESGLSLLTKDYLRKIKINTIKLSSGNFKLINISKDKRLNTSGKINFLLKGFEFNPMGSDTKKFFNAENFTVELDNYVLKASNNAQQIIMEKLRISTFDSEIYLKGFKMIPVESENVNRILRKNNKSLLIDFEIPELRINETHIHEALLNNNIKISNINIFSPKLLLTSFPNISAKKHQFDLMKKLKYTAIANTTKRKYKAKNKLAEINPGYSIVEYQILKRKENAIDTIYNFTVRNINNLFVRAKTIHANDSIYQPIEEMQFVAVAGIEKLSTDSLKAYQIDSIKNYVFDRIENIKYDVEAPRITKKELFASIGSFFKIIDVDSLNIYNSKLTFKQQRENEIKTIFDNTLSLGLIDFYFNYDSLEVASDRILFSKDIEINLKNYKFNLNDNVHKLNVREINLSTLKSRIDLNNITIIPDSTKADFNKIPSLMYAYIYNIKFEDFNMLKFFNDKFLDIQKLTINKPRMSVLLQNKKEENDSLNIKEKLVQLILPRDIKKLNISEFKIDSGRVLLSERIGEKEVTLFNGDFKLMMNDFFIDSVTYVKNNPLFLPVKSIQMQLDNVKVPLPDSIHTIDIVNVDISTENKSIVLKNLRISNNAKSDKYKRLYNADKSELMNINIPEIKIGGFIFEKINLANEIITSEITIPQAEVSIESFPILKKQKLRKKKFKLNGIDLFTPISGKFKKVACNKFNLHDLSLQFDKHEKGTVKQLSLKNISAYITNLEIDSTAQKRKLLYSDDIVLKIRHYSKEIKDGELTFGATQIAVSTGKKEISLDSFYLSPNYAHKEYTKMLGYDKAVTDIYANNLTIAKLDLKALTERRKLISDSVMLSGLDFYVYKNLNLKHYSDTLKELFIDKIIEMPFYMNVKKFYIRDSKISYEQLSKGAHRVGKIYLDNIDGDIENLTNDAILIASGTNTIVNVTARLMGEGELEMDIVYPLDHVNSMFTMEGSLTNTDLTLLNTFLNDAMDVKIKSGKLDDMEFEIAFADSVAKGFVKMKYNNINAVLLRKDTTYRIVRQEYKFLSFVANLLVVRTNNPRYGVYMKRGRVGYFHDWSYGEVKFWILSIVSGMQSTMLFDSRATRQIHRESRRKVKRNKKELKKMGVR